MKKRTMLMLVISIISVLGASTLVYYALTPNAANYEAEPNGEVISDTTTTELISSETTIAETNVSTIIDSATNKTSPLVTTAKQGTTTKVGTTNAPATQAPAAIQPPVTTKAPAATQAPTVKGNAADFTIYDSNNNPVKLSDYIGKAVVLNFWASWCPPCKAEMPDFQSMYTKYSGENIVFLMVNMTDGSRETKASATAYLNSNKFTFTPLFDTKQSASSAYGISSIPGTYFITRAGNISNKYIGQMNAATLENEIKAILK